MRLRELCDHPPLTGLRLVARPKSKLHLGGFYPATILGETVVCLSSCIGHGDDIMIDYPAPDGRESAERVRWWLRDLGFRHVYCNPIGGGRKLSEVEEAYRDEGGES